MAEGLQLALTESYDTAVVEIKLPGLGLSLTRTAAKVTPCPYPERKRTVETAALQKVEMTLTKPPGSSEWRGAR
jgi:hypothetical protein